MPIGSGMMKDSSTTKRPLLYRRNPNGIRRYAHRAEARRRLEPWARKECLWNAALQSCVLQLDIGGLRVRGQIHDYKNGLSTCRCSPDKTKHIRILLIHDRNAPISHRGR